MKVLLVGGAGDGLRLELREGATRYDHPTFAKIITKHSGIEQMQPLRTSMDRYELFQLEPKTSTVIFAQMGLEPSRVVELLLYGYAPARRT